MFIVVQQFHADAVILALDSRDLAAEAVLQHLILMGKHLHGLLIGKKILQMVQDESADPFRRIVDLVEPLTQPCHNRGERVFLDQEQKFFFGFEIVVKV